MFLIHVVCPSICVEKRANLIEVEDALKNADNARTDPHIVIEGWNLLENILHNWAKDFVQSYRHDINQILKSSNVSEECVQSVNDVLNGVKNLESWAIKSKNSLIKFLRFPYANIVFNICQ